MRIVVILGRVLDPSGIVVNRRRGRIFVNREEYVLQPADRCALEAALSISDANGAEVVALQRGPLPDDDVLRQALATGVDRAIYLAGEGFAEADDAAMAGVLAAAVERLGGADLVLIGASALDTGQGQLGPRLAEALGWPQILGAWAVEAADGRVQAVLQPSRGQETRFSGKDPISVEADLPALVTVLPGSLKPRYPDGVRLVNVYRGVGELAEALEEWNVVDLVAADAIKPLLERRGQDFPPERERGTRASGTPGEMAQVVADALRQRVGG